MDLNTITLVDFKVQFRRDFPYLPTYDTSKLYNAGTRVYYPTTDLFYDCKVNGTTGIAPTDTTKWNVVAGASVDDYVADEDITRAFGEGSVNFNQSLWADDNSIKLGYLYLAAHYMVQDLRAGAGGVAATPSFLLTSKSVGNVSESYGIPQRYLDNPQFSYLATTPYGLKYLSLIIPRLVGNVVAFSGGTTP